MARLRFTISGEWDADPEHYCDDDGNPIIGIQPSEMAAMDQANVENVTGDYHDVVDWADYDSLKLKIEPADDKTLAEARELVARCDAVLAQDGTPSVNPLTYRFAKALIV